MKIRPSRRRPLQVNTFYRKPRLENLESRQLLAADFTSALGNLRFASELDDIGPSSPIHLQTQTQTQTQSQAEAEAVETEFIEMTGINVRATDPAGNPLTHLTVGEEFELQVLVQDLRLDVDFYGVFAAYLDITYDPSLATIVGDLTYGSAYPNGREADLSVEGVIDEAGAFAGITPLGTSEFELFSVPMRPLQTGQVTFGTNPADDIPAHYVLLYGRDDPVADESVVFGETTLEILEPPAEFIVDNSDSGYQETGAGWFTGGLAGAVNGDYRYHAGGNGSNGATWSFSNLPLGQYEVSATWVPHANRATDAPFIVRHNGGVVGEFRLDQTIAPSDEVVDNQPWEHLTTVDVTTGSLTVQLSDAANAAVVADAVRLLEFRPTPQPPEIGSVSATPASVVTGNSVLLAANNVTDEGSIASASFYLDANNNGRVDAGVDPLIGTDVDGSDGYQATADTTELELGEHVFLVEVENDLGLKSISSVTVQVTDVPPPPPPLEKVIDDGESGYSESGTWFTGGLAGANQGDYRYSQSSQGAATASWSFSALAVGDYEVMATWVSHANRASNATYKMLDATVERSTQTVNQQQAPNDLTVEGQAWERLDTVNVQSGTLVVNLSNNANGVVIADAIRLVAAGDSPPPDNAPTIQSLTASPSSVVVENSITLTASGVADTDGSIAAVQFYRDSNGNGTLEVGSDAVVGSDTDGSNGYQASITAPPAPSTVRFFAQATDNDGLTSNVVTTVVNVTADTPPPSNDRFLDNGEAGYSEQGTGWFTGGLGGSYQGDYRYTQPGDGSRQAEWLMDNVDPGTYDVFTTWVAHENRANNATYEIFDNSASQDTAIVNQQQAPAGPEADGQVWHKLGQFVLNNGALRVVLNNAANGVVVADALRLVAVPVGPQAPVIGSLDVTPSNVLQGDEVTIRAEQVGDVDGSVVQVDFYRDTNGNNSLDIGQDKLVGSDTNSADGFQVTEDTDSLSLGAHHYFAQALDDDGLLSNIATDVANVVDQADLFVDNTDSGYQETGTGWFTGGLEGAFQGDYRYHQAGSGANHARFTVDGLLDGDYEVFATWTAHANRATNAQFRIFDNTSFQGEARRNQQQAPDDSIASGQDWESLGTFRIRSGRLLVELTDDADGVVIADAIRVVAR